MTKGKTWTKKENKDLDRLAECLKGVPSARLRSLLVKTEAVTIRVTASDKAAMERAAKHCRITLTDYLTRLHLFASEKLFHEAGKKKGEE